jgi:hypothetical protein
MYRPLDHHALQFLNSRKNPPPNRSAVQVALGQHLIHPHSGVKGCTFALSVDAGAEARALWLR